ncbi:AtuA-related protein [Roseomonas sp. WA12]
MSAIVELPLHRLAHARAGDKGNRLNLGLFAYRPEIWPLIAEQVTEARVMELFAHRGATRVRRYDLPNLDGFNFVVDDVLQGGVNGALNLDGHGKTLSFRLLSLTLRVPEALSSG